MVVEFNDNQGYITIEGEENNLLTSFDNPFQFNCWFCEFIATSERRLRGHKSRKHCERVNEMKIHKMEQHTLKYRPAKSAENKML